MSRSAASIIGGMQQKLTREVQLLNFLSFGRTYTFGATVYKLYKYYKTQGGFSSNDIELLVAGNVVSFIVAHPRHQVLHQLSEETRFPHLGILQNRGGNHSVNNDWNRYSNRSVSSRDFHFILIQSTYSKLRSYNILCTAASISLLVNGNPLILFNPMASTRNSLRIIFTNWPLFSSGTRILSYFFRSLPRLRGKGLR